MKSNEIVIISMNFDNIFDILRIFLKKVNEFLMGVQNGWVQNAYEYVKAYLP